MPAATRIADRVGNFMVGKYSGTTAAQNIYIGFKPSFIIFINTTDGDTVNFWSKDSATAYVSITGAAATVSAAIAGVEDGSGIGFSLAADAVNNENAKNFVFIAFPE